MSWKPAEEPVCSRAVHEHIEHVIEGRERDIGAFSVRRLLPAAERRMVGPYIFFDEMGPAVIPPGGGMDVRPHPHINLATVTYLFEGEIQHKDSLGSDRTIAPGAINWMTTGRGIVHSERTPNHRRANGLAIHGIQLWVALPEEHEEAPPAFVHYPADSIPEVERDGATLRVLIGRAYGQVSPVVTLPVMFYVDARLSAGAGLALPEQYSERAAYVVAGRVRCGGRDFERGQMVVFAGGCQPDLEAVEDARLVLLGGEPVGERHIWWNFVSSSKERIETAKNDWSKGPGHSAAFPEVPGDSDEYIPLPE